MKCEDCKDCDRCWCTVDVDTYPDGSHPCKYCNSKENLYMEFPKEGDWDTGKFVVRMGCLCDECDKDLELTYKWRTTFGEITGLVDEWNEMNEKVLVPTFKLGESKTSLTDVKNKLYEEGDLSTEINGNCKFTTVKDITLKDLANLKESCPELIEKIREVWVGDIPERESKYRIGTMYMMKCEEWSGKTDNIVITLRFPIQDE